jgi:hypothetical protein
MYRHIGTRYSLMQALRVWLRARRFAILRERKEVDRWELALGLPTRPW